MQIISLSSTWGYFLHVFHVQMGFSRLNSLLAVIPIFVFVWYWMWLLHLSQADCDSCIKSHTKDRFLQLCPAAYDTFTYPSISEIFSCICLFGTHVLSVSIVLLGVRYDPCPSVCVHPTVWPMKCDLCGPRRFQTWLSEPKASGITIELWWSAWFHLLFLEKT